MVACECFTPLPASSAEVRRPDATGGRSGEPASAPAPALSFEHVRFSYPGCDEPVLRDACLRVEEGAFVLLVGDTGSGKSTLLRLAKPEIAPAGELAGGVRVFGRDVRGLSVTESAQTVGYVFQNPDNQIVTESVWHEMAFGLESLGTPRDEMRRRIAETCYFLGLESLFREDVVTLSGGRKQLLALGSVLAMRPRLLLLDEPTSQLDPIAEKSFLHALFRVSRELGCTVVVATHEPRAFADYATQAYRLEGGALAPVDMDELREIPWVLERPDEKPAPASAAATEKPVSSCDSPRSNRAAGAGTDRRGSGAVAASGDGHVAGVGGGLGLSHAWFRHERACPWVLRGFDLFIREGEVHALVGGNGCGKSTVLNVLAGAYKPMRGACRNPLRSSQALLPQDPRALLTAETVHGELMEWAGGSYGEEEVRSMLGAMGLDGLEAHHPFDLSGGQQQLLALAKLLLVKPRLLLLDEPTKGLDLGARRTLARVLTELAATGGTVVMASHDLAFVQQLADRVTMMFDGEAACTQESGEFFRDNIYYRP